MDSRRWRRPYAGAIVYPLCSPRLWPAGSALSDAICAPAGFLLRVTPVHCALPPSQRCAWPPIRFAHSTMTSIASAPPAARKCYPGLADPVAAGARSRVSSCLPLFLPLSPTPFCPLPLAHAPLRVRCCSVRHPALNSGTAFPKELQTYLHGYNILLLDVRNRADFDKARSFVLSRLFSGGRGALTAEHGERADERDDDVREPGQVRPDRRVLPVVADAQGAEYANVETAFTKLLKGMPLALVGGFDARRSEVGEQGTAAAKASSPAPMSLTSSTGSSSSSSAAAAAPMVNGYSSVNGANGVNGAAPMANGFSSSSSSSSSTSMTNGFAGSASTSPLSSDTQHQLWTPRSRADYQPHTAAARDDVPASAGTTRSIRALGIRDRSPAEITHPKNYQSGADCVSRANTGSRRPTLSRAGQSAAGPSSFALPASVDERHLLLLLLLLIHHLPLLHARARVRVRLALPPSLNHTGPSPPAAIASPPLASIHPTCRGGAATTSTSPPRPSPRCTRAGPSPPAPRDRLPRPRSRRRRSSGRTGQGGRVSLSLAGPGLVMVEVGAVGARRGSRAT
ncbi:hypothetical protein B0H14DRAFT_3160020, partial [Mycena olivaceomarginata]